jgi:two-component system chemotaxis response regulator CheB
MNAVHNGKAVHYLCHTGHSYSPQTFIAARDDRIESALYTALSAMQEKGTVLRDLAAQAREAGDREDSLRRLAAAEEVDHAAGVLQDYIVRPGD